MSGLLYKDFIATKCGYLLGGILAGLGLLWLCGMFLPVSKELLDISLAFIMLLIIGGMYFIVISVLEVSVMNSDCGKKKQAYILSLPVSGKDYVASKYLFMLISLYVAMGVSMVYIFVFDAICQTDMVREMVELIGNLLPLLACVLVFIPAVELPFYFAFGTKAGGQVKTGLVVTLFFIITVYLMFGDLTLLEQFNIMTLIEYLQEHQNRLMIFQGMLPYISILTYYISYCLACSLFVGKEREYD